MMKYLKEIKQRVCNWFVMQRNLAQEWKDADLDIESQRNVQAMEWQGTLYLAVNGVPVVEIDNLRDSLANSVLKARASYRDWKEEKAWEKHR